MKKIFTLMVLAVFMGLSVMAQITLGPAKFSIKDGTKVNPSRTNVVLSFPSIEGVANPLETTMEVAGSFVELGEDGAFDGLQGLVGEGVTIALGDFDLPASSTLTLSITSVKIDGTELLKDTTYNLTFKTRGAERKMSWTFTIDQESSDKIKADADSESPVMFTYVKAGDATRFYVAKRSNEEILFADGTPLPMTEELTFNFGGSKLYVGNASEGMTKYQKLIAFNSNNMGITIPDCEEGDVITFNANRATKASATKFTAITANNGAAIAPEGFVSQSGVQDSIQLGSSYANFKFKVVKAGDISFTCSNCLMASINVEAAKEEVECTYNIVAGYQNDGETKVIKEIVSGVKAMSGTTAKTNYSYWLADPEGQLYTLGTRGQEFVYSFDLKSDTTFVLPYKKTDIENVVFCSEMEDIEGTTLCTSANAAVRSSNCKAAYAENDVKITTLPAGTYKIKAVMFDAANAAGYTAQMAVGKDTLMLSATQVNFSEAESEIFTIEAETDVIYMAGGSGTTGVDVIAIYETDEVPEEPVVAGDANADGTVSVADLSLIATYILNGTAEGINLKNADANGDGEVSVADISAVAAKILSNE